MSERNNNSDSRFTVFAVPHDGRLLKTRMRLFCVPEETVRFYHEQMRDKYVRYLAPVLDEREGAMITFHLSRLQCDAERREGPEEIMEKYGMGIWYEKAYDGTVINRRHEHRPELYRSYIHYHWKINHLCETHPRVLLIDLHSYHNVIVPSDFLVYGRRTPDLCIGADPVFTPLAFLDTVRARFEGIGLTVDVNYPYTGCYIPEKVADGSCSCDFIGLMLEFHRRAYLDENGRINPERKEKIQETIRKIIADSAAF